MKTILLAVLLLLGVVALLSRFLISGSNPFIRLMDKIPADTALCHFDQCVKEIGPIWFFYSCFTKEDRRLLTLSLNVPCPVDEEDQKGLDAEIRRITASLSASRMAPTRCEWREMEGPLAWRLYLEFDWESVGAESLVRMQEDLLEAIRKYRAEKVRYCFRGSGDLNIYYSEQVGNVVMRSLDMADAFDIRKYSFKSEGLLGYREDKESPVTAETFEELYDAAKPDIDIRGLSLKSLRSCFNGLYRDETILERPVLRGGRLKKYLEAWFRDREGAWQNWNITLSGGSWWVYSVEKGELGDICELDDEEEACDLFVRYVVEGLQNAEYEG